jgi:hypothetical protein
MDDLKSTIGRLIQDANAQDSTDIRSDLFDQYMAEPYGDETKGQSSFVSSDVADVVEGLLPDIMDVFTSSENLVEFTPVGAEDEDAAKQETDAVSHMFWQKTDGFTLLYTWIKEALIQQNSYVKRGWVEKERVTIEEYEDLTEDELMQIFSQIDGDYEILESSETVEGEPQVDPNTGEEIPPPVMTNVKFRCTKTDKEYAIDCIPQDEFFLTPRWNKLSLTGVPCCGHRRSMERGELRSMGFSEESIEAAGSEDLDSFAKQNRWDTETVFEDTANEGDDSTKKCTIYEAYIRADLNDDGKAELLKVWSGGDGSQIMTWENGEDAIEEVSHVPFSAITPYLVPHRHVGRCPAELVTDIQRVNTVLTRHTLDNLYKTNYARPAFDENMASSDTYNDLANPAHGAPIRTGGAIIDWHRPPSVIDTTLPIMQRMDQLKENRTGATRYNQGLDPESLNKTAAGQRMTMNAGQKKTMLIARTLAETGLRDLFLGIHRDLRSGPMKEIVMKLRGEWTPINPRTWKDRSDMNIAVGMGSGNRDQKRAAIGMFGEIQRELIQNGSRMVDEQKIYSATAKMAETYGIKSIEPYFHDPRTLPPMPPAPPPPPDPMMIAAQSQADKVQADMQIDMMNAQLKQQEMQGKQQLEMRKLELDGEKIRLEQSKLQLEAAKLAQAKEFEDEDNIADAMALDLKREEMEGKMAIEREKLDLARAQATPDIDAHLVYTEDLG